MLTEHAETQRIKSIHSASRPDLVRLKLATKTHSQKNRDINDMKSHFCLLLLYFGLEMFPERSMGWRLSPYTVVPLGSCGTLTRWDPEDKISSLKICPLRVCWNPSPLLYTILFPGCMNSIKFSAIHSSLRYGTLPWPQMHQGETTLHWNIWNCESNTPFLLISYCVSGIFIGTRSQLTHFQAPEGEQ